DRQVRAGRAPSRTARPHSSRRSRRTEYTTKPAPRARQALPPTRYGVLSKLPVSASRAPSAERSKDALVAPDATLACSVTCGDGTAVVRPPPGACGVGLADV